MSDTIALVTTEADADLVGDPFAVRDRVQLTDELRRGRWVVYAHEWLPHGLELGEWKSATAKACTEAGLTAELVTYDATSTTIVLNTAAMPTLDQIEASISAIEQFREKGPR